MIFVPNGNPPYLHISFTNNKVKTFSKFLTIETHEAPTYNDAMKLFECLKYPYKLGILFIVIFIF